MEIIENDSRPASQTPIEPVQDTFNVLELNQKKNQAVTNSATKLQESIDSNNQVSKLLSETSNFAMKKQASLKPVVSVPSRKIEGAILNKCESLGSYSKLEHKSIRGEQLKIFRDGKIRAKIRQHQVRNRSNGREFESHGSRHRRKGSDLVKDENYTNYYGSLNDDMADIITRKTKYGKDGFVLNNPKNQQKDQISKKNDETEKTVI